MAPEIVCHYGRCYANNHEYHVTVGITLGVLVFMALVMLVTWAGRRRR